MKTETYDCQSCGAQATRAVARGQRPKWCPSCRSAGKRAHACAACGTMGVHVGSAACSRICGVYVRIGHWPMSAVPDTHRSRSTLIPRQHPARTPVPAPRLWTAGTCPECAETFVDRQAGRFCSPLCAKRYHRRAWKERKGRIVPVAVRQQVYARDAGICQLCLDPVDMTAAGELHGPSLDHIECQSWSLIPDHGADNLRLAHLICNSRRGDRIA